MTVRYFDLLPLNDGRFILRAASNGREVLRSMKGQSRASFTAECRGYVKNKSTRERDARLRIFDEFGREKDKEPAHD